ncbi:hypothetical protein F5B22DRAFT_616018 [Xylaria bambusicola]|uniref:uncharacterized protein n=1 Tax=Xylaria bambusicola TaxID=326684 RepID=UPI0020087AF0|nr:uncharacterized protein F5B22DRAFT_616018 [Xylaria bambusicola]KAI0509570.1 hypothetical protein F5B22DRAFT_616018 [Xylaria bambusicola]
MKASSIISVLALGATALARPKHGGHLPTTTVAGVEVVDTQIVRDARALIEKFPDFLYWHSMRTWLLGAAVLNANATLKAQVDLEAHALGTILHDLGWDMSPDSPWVTKENRFEVDGGLGAVRWIKAHKSYKSCVWTEARLERIFDGIALHGTFGIHPFKNIDTKWITNSVGFDGVNFTPQEVPIEKFNSVVAEFPKDSFQKGAIDTFTWMAATKPNGTYNTFVEPFGTHYVPGYNSTGKHSFDRITAGYVPDKN